MHGALKIVERAKIAQPGAASPEAPMTSDAMVNCRVIVMNGPPQRCRYNHYLFSRWINPRQTPPAALCTRPPRVFMLTRTAAVLPALE